MYTIFKTIQYPLLCIVCKQAEKPFSLKFIRSSAFTLSFFLDAFQFPNQVTQITRTHRKKKGFQNDSIPVTEAVFFSLGWHSITFLSGIIFHIRFIASESFVALAKIKQQQHNVEWVKNFRAKNNKYHLFDVFGMRANGKTTTTTTMKHKENGHSPTMAEMRKIHGSHERI